MIGMTTVVSARCLSECAGAAPGSRRIVRLVPNCAYFDVFYGFVRDLLIWSSFYNHSNYVANLVFRTRVECPQKQYQYNYVQNIYIFGPNKLRVRARDLGFCARADYALFVRLCESVK